MIDLPGDHPPPHRGLVRQKPLIFTLKKGDPGARSIHAYGEPGESGILELNNYIPRQQGRSAWRQRNSDARRTSVTDQLEQIRPLDRVPSCKHKHLDLQRCNLVNQILSLIGVEFHGVPIRLS
jgi:hypothetical protein